MTSLAERPCISVVIPCRDVVGVLEGQLAALAQQNYANPFEVLLADNGSADGLKGRVSAWRDEFDLDLRWVNASGVPGVSHARNAGLRDARADVVAICDADDVVTSGWLQAMATAVEGAALVAGAVDVRALNDPRLVAWRPGPKSDSPPSKLGFLPYAMGCNVAVRRDVALAHGGWREDYVAGGDDVEFSWRLQLRGVDLAFTAEAVVQYRYRDDLAGMARQIRGYTRCESKLIKDFAEHGAQRQRPSQLRRDLGWVVRNLRLLRGDEVDRGRWICRVAALQGRVAGVIKHRRLV